MKIRLMKIRLMKMITPKKPKIREKKKMMLRKKMKNEILYLLFYN